MVGYGYHAGSEAAQKAAAKGKHAFLEHGIKSVRDLPASVDWRTVSPSVVTPVKDQGGCGSCWAFSTVSTLESAVAIATGKLFVLSPQQVVSCTPNPNQCGGTGGCSGATQELGFDYSIKGITTDALYPYTATTGKCPKTLPAPVAADTGHVMLPPNNATALLNAVTIMPIAISAAAAPWQSYGSGVFGASSKTCGSDPVAAVDVDHAIVLEGFGSVSFCRARVF